MLCKRRRGAFLIIVFLCCDLEGNHRVSSLVVFSRKRVLLEVRWKGEGGRKSHHLTFLPMGGSQRDDGSRGVNIHQKVGPTFLHKAEMEPHLFFQISMGDYLVQSRV